MEPGRVKEISPQCPFMSVRRTTKLIAGLDLWRPAAECRERDETGNGRGCPDVPNFRHNSPILASRIRCHRQADFLPFASVFTASPASACITGRSR